MTDSSVLPLSSTPTSPGRAARRLSYKLRNRAERHIVPIILFTFVLASVFLFYSPHTPHAHLDNGAGLHLYSRDLQHAFGVNRLDGKGKGVTSGDKNGVSLLTQGEDELIAEDDLFWDKYEEAAPMTDEEVAAAAEIKAHREDVVAQNNIGSLRALVWWLAEGGSIPDDWEVPSKAYLKKVGARGMERLLEDIDPGEESQWIFEDGWADFAMKRYRVVVFSKSYCPYSKNAKSILEKYHVSPAPFVIELDQRPDTVHIQSLLSHLTGRRTVPNILFDFTSVGGSDDLTLLHAEGGLQRKLEEMEVIPGARLRRAPFVPPKPPARAAADIPRKAPKAKDVPVPQAPNAAKPPQAKVQDDVVLPNEVGYHGPEVGTQADDSIANARQEEGESEEFLPDVKPNAQALAQLQGPVQVIPKGASLEDIRAAVQAAHGIDYLEAALDEQFEYNVDDAILAPIALQPPARDPLEQDVTVQPVDAVEEPIPELMIDEAGEDEESEEEVNEDTKALLFETEDRTQMPIGKPVTDKKAAAKPEPATEADHDSEPEEDAVLDNEEEEEEQIVDDASDEKHDGPAAGPLENDNVPADKIAKGKVNAQDTPQIPRDPATPPAPLDAKVKQDDVVADGDAAGRARGVRGAKAKARARAAERKAKADANRSDKEMLDKKPPTAGNDAKGIKREAVAVKGKGKARKAKTLDEKSGSGPNARARKDKPLDEKQPAPRAQGNDNARQPAPELKAKAETPKERAADLQPKAPTKKKVDGLETDKLSNDLAERAAQINALAKAMGGGRKLADRAKAQAKQKKDAATKKDERPVAEKKIVSKNDSQQGAEKVEKDGKGVTEKVAKKDGQAKPKARAKPPAKKAAAAGKGEKKRGAVLGKGVEGKVNGARVPVKGKRLSTAQRLGARLAAVADVGKKRGKVLA